MLMQGIKEKDARIILEDNTFILCFRIYNLLFSLQEITRRSLVELYFILIQSERDPSDFRFVRYRPADQGAQSKTNQIDVRKCASMNYK